MRRLLALVRVVGVALPAGLKAGCLGPGQSTPAVSGGAPNNPWTASEARARCAAERGPVVYEVRYQRAVFVFDVRSTEGAVKTISADGATYTLDPRVPAAAQRQPGSINERPGVRVSFAPFSQKLNELNDIASPRHQFPPLPPFLERKTVMFWKNDIRCSDVVGKRS